MCVGALATSNLARSQDFSQSEVESLMRSQNWAQARLKLQRSGSKSVVHIVRVMDGDRKLQERGMEVIELLGPQAVPALLQCLEDEGDPYGAAYYGLRVLDGRSLLPMLSGSKGKAWPVRMAALVGAAYCALHGGLPPSDAPRVLSHLRELASHPDPNSAHTMGRRILGWLGPVAMPTITAMASSSIVEERRAASVACVRAIELHNPFFTLTNEEIEQQRVYTGMLRRALKDADASVRATSCYGLSNSVDGKEASPLFAQRLDDPSAIVRANALAAMARVKGKGYVQAATRLKGDPDQEVRRVAYVILHQHRRGSGPSP